MGSSRLANDVDPSNDSATTSLEETASLQTGFRTANSPILVQQGTTCRDTVELMGRATPGIQLSLTVDGAASGQPVTVGADGRWPQTVSGLSDGLHLVRVEPPIKSPYERSVFFRPEVGDEVVVRVAQPTARSWTAATASPIPRPPARTEASSSRRRRASTGCWW